MDYPIPEIIWQYSVVGIAVDGYRTPIITTPDFDEAHVCYRYTCRERNFHRAELLRRPNNSWQILEDSTRDQAS
jgi:hypothetical protein